jgi:hypothetical protein
MKRFGGEKYEAVLKRLAWWALPLAQLIEGQRLAPYLVDLLRGMAESERELVGEHLELVINQVFDPPAEVKCAWSNRLFSEARLRADLVKFGLAGGPVSQATLQEELGVDPDEERARKAAEKELPEGETMPIYDPNHGPPKAPKGVAGRPAGAATQ